MRGNAGVFDAAPRRGQCDQSNWRDAQVALGGQWPRETRRVAKDRISLLMVYPKNEQDDLTANQLKQLKNQLMP